MPLSRRGLFGVLAAVPVVAPAVIGAAQAAQPSERQWRVTWPRWDCPDSEAYEREMRPGGNRAKAEEIKARAVQRLLDSGDFEWVD